MASDNYAVIYEISPELLFKDESEDIWAANKHQIAGIFVFHISLH